MLDYILVHHGIKGQKWGVRRFQNPDGTLTSAGKARKKSGGKLDYKNLDSQFRKSYEIYDKNREDYRKKHMSEALEEERLREKNLRKAEAIEREGWTKERWQEYASDPDVMREEQLIKQFSDARNQQLLENSNRNYQIAEKYANQYFKEHKKLYMNDIYNTAPDYGDYVIDLLGSADKKYTMNYNSNKGWYFTKK